LFRSVVSKLEDVNSTVEIADSFAGNTLKRQKCFETVYNLLNFAVGWAPPTGGQSPPYSAVGKPSRILPDIASIIV
jgi:hypothetical protein